MFEETRGLSITFANNNPKGRPTSVKWENVVDNEVTGTLSFDYLIDATGREGLIAQKYLKHRTINTSLRNIACWGYWKGAGVYGAGTNRENAPWFEAHTGIFSVVLVIHAYLRALKGGSGWNWFIPLHDGMTSIGVVMDVVAGNQRKKATKRANGGVTPTVSQHYLDCLQLSPGLMDLLGEATLVEQGPYSVVQSASDFSYNAPTYSGEHYRLVGDAAGERILVLTINCL